jgi:hypothetical protein
LDHASDSDEVLRWDHQDALRDDPVRNERPERDTAGEVEMEVVGFGRVLEVVDALAAEVRAREDLAELDAAAPGGRALRWDPSERGRSRGRR